MKKRQKFSAEFKREAVRQLRESGLSPLLGAKGHCRTVQRRILPTQRHAMTRIQIWIPALATVVLEVAAAAVTTKLRAHAYLPT